MPGRGCSTHARMAANAANASATPHRIASWYTYGPTPRNTIVVPVPRTNAVTPASTSSPPSTGVSARPAPDAPTDATECHHRHREREQHRDIAGTTVERIGEHGGRKPQQRGRRTEVHVRLPCVLVPLDPEHRFGHRELALEHAVRLRVVEVARERHPVAGIERAVGEHPREHERRQHGADREPASEASTARRRRPAGQPDAPTPWTLGENASPRNGRSTSRSTVITTTHATSTIIRLRSR